MWSAPFPWSQAQPPSHCLAWRSKRSPAGHGKSCWVSVSVFGCSLTKSCHYVCAAQREAGKKCTKRNQPQQKCCWRRVFRVGHYCSKWCSSVPFIINLSIVGDKKAVTILAYLICFNACSTVQLRWDRHFLLWRFVVRHLDHTLDKLLKLLDCHTSHPTYTDTHSCKNGWVDIGSAIAPPLEEQFNVIL